MALGLLALPERLLDKIQPEPNSGCWLWTGATRGSGYGATWDGKRVVGAHRLVYQLLIGDIQKPMLDHLCRVHCCVNPSHLRQATPRENTLATGSRAASKAHSEKECCPKCGGDYVTVRRPSRGGNERLCLRCKRATANRYCARHRSLLRSRYRERKRSIS